MPIPDDVSFWKWLAGIAVSGAAGLASGIWFSSKKITTLETSDADHLRRIMLLERRREIQEKFCNERKAELLQELGKEICNVVKQAMLNAEIMHNKELAEIGLDVALQRQVLSQIQGKVDAIFGRMNRRAKPDSGQEEHE